MLQEHHEGYIDWAEFERYQKQLAANTYGRVGGVKSGRGGQALLAVLLTCAHCGRRLTVVYTGRPRGQRVYRCDRPNLMLGEPRCLTFGGSHVEAVLARELLRAVEPMAIEAALEAEHVRMDIQNERRRVAELELQQARYEASLVQQNQRSSGERGLSVLRLESKSAIMRVSGNNEATITRVLSPQLCWGDQRQLNVFMSSLRIKQ